MKPVRVYHVGVRHEMIPEHRNEMEMDYFRPPYVTRLDHQTNGPCLIDSMEDSVVRVRMPVQEFCEVVNDKTHPMLRRDPIDLPPVKRTYIALDPELENFMAIKYNGKIDELKRALGSLEEELSGALAKYHTANSAYSAWWAAPWYKRVWAAMTGGA